MTNYTITTSGFPDKRKKLHRYVIPTNSTEVIPSEEHTLKRLLQLQRVKTRARERYKERYITDPEYRVKKHISHMKYKRRKYQTYPRYRQEQIQESSTRILEKYHTNPEYRAKKIEYAKQYQKKHYQKKKR